MKINYFFLFDRSCATTKSTNSKNMMAKRLAHGCYVGYFWPGHQPNQGVVAGGVGGGGAVWLQQPVSVVSHSFSDSFLQP